MTQVCNRKLSLLLAGYVNANFFEFQCEGLIRGDINHFVQCPSLFVFTLSQRAFTDEDAPHTESSGKSITVALTFTPYRPNSRKEDEEEEEEEGVLGISSVSAGSAISFL